MDGIGACLSVTLDAQFLVLDDGLGGGREWAWSRAHGPACHGGIASARRARCARLGL